MLTNVEKQDYIDAVLCLQTKEPVVSNPEAQNAFDDLHAVHLDQTPNIHWVVSLGLPTKLLLDMSDVL